MNLKLSICHLTLTQYSFNHAIFFSSCSSLFFFVENYYFVTHLTELDSEFQTVTAGKYKRTLTPTKKVTKEDLEKSKEELEGVLLLFKDFVHQNRPSLDIDKVATGETWFGEEALKQGLCDAIATMVTTQVFRFLSDSKCSNPVRGQISRLFFSVKCLGRLYLVLPLW